MSRTYLSTFLALLALVTFAVPAEAQAARKRHPGHYTVMMGYADGPTTLTSTITTDGVTGIVKRYSWRELEPKRGTYNLTEVVADLNLVASYGGYFVIMVEDKSFGGGEEALPDYLFPYAMPNATGGHTVARWDPFVVLRYKALITAIANRVGNHPALEGIALLESAPSVSSTQLAKFNYTPEKYRDAYIAEIRHIGTVMPTVRTFWYANFIPGNQSYIASVVTATKAYGLVLSCPDIWPENKSLVTRMYPFFDQFQSTVTLAAQVEGVNYRQQKADGSYYTVQELFRYGRDKMHLDYVFWVRMLNPGKTAMPNWNKAKDVFRTEPAPFNTLP